MMGIIETLKQYANLIIGGVILAVVGYAWWYVHDLNTQLSDVKTEYAAHLAADQEAVNEAVKLSEETNATVQLQHTKDILATKTTAGRAAVAAYIAGLLPSGGSVCGEQSGGSSQAVHSKGADATTSEQRTSSSGQSFAERCASDALTVISWQEWAHGNQLEIK